MNILQSFKNDLVIVDTQLLRWGENALSTELNFFLWIHFVAINNLFLYIINTQNKINGRPHHFIYNILNIQGETTQREPTQGERVFGTKPPSAKTWSARNHLDSLQQSYPLNSQRKHFIVYLYIFQKNYISLLCIYIIPCIWMRIVTHNISRYY